jgi:hypothetical protein
MPTPNVPMLRKAVEWVEEQDKLPEIDREWDQSDFRRSPEAYALYLMFQVRNALGVRVGHGHLKKAAQVLEPHCGTVFCVAGYVGQLTDERYRFHEVVNDIHVAQFAQQVLGLTEDQANEMFDGCNTAADIRRIAERVAGEQL